MKKIINMFLVLCFITPTLVLAKENIIVDTKDIEIIRGESAVINIGLNNAVGRINISSSNNNVSVSKSDLFLDIASDTVTIIGNNVGDSIISVYAYDVSTYDSIDLSGKEYKIKVTVKYRDGDVNHNNKIDISDINQLLKWYINNDNLSEEDKKVGDINGNNKIDLNDVVLLLKIYLGK